MDTFTDERDGNQYKIIKINNLLWFAENFRSLQYPHLFPGRCSDSVPDYGCLYNMEAALMGAPEGWRLPTREEYKKLSSADIEDFLMAPAAGYNLNTEYWSFNIHGCYWTGTPGEEDYTAYSFNVENLKYPRMLVTGDLSYMLVEDCSSLMSVRYVKEIQDG